MGNITGDFKNLKPFTSKRRRNLPTSPILIDFRCHKILGTSRAELHIKILYLLLSSQHLSMSTNVCCLLHSFLLISLIWNNPVRLYLSSTIYSLQNIFPTTLISPKLPDLTEWNQGWHQREEEKMAISHKDCVCVQCFPKHLL